MTATATRTAPDAPPPVGRPALPRRAARRLVQIVATLAALAAVGAATQAVAERRDAQAHPPPGDLVALPDGRVLHLQVSGEQHTGGPTVVLETGMGGFSAAWGWIQPALAEHVTVVSYDRAGLGWSDPSDNRPDVRAVVTDLRDALHARGLPGPYILVGHSLGGHYARAFTAAHPDDVAGLVLVDPSHEDQSAALGIDPAQADLGMAVLQAATRIGLTRLHHPATGDVGLLPEPARTHALAGQLTVSNARQTRAEFAGIDDAGAHVAGRGVGARPLRILMAGAAPDETSQAAVDRLNELREALTGLSTESEARLVPNASHVTIVTDAEHAAIVTDTILEVVAAVGQVTR